MRDDDADEDELAGLNFDAAADEEKEGLDEEEEEDDDDDDDDDDAMVDETSALPNKIAAVRGPVRDVLAGFGGDGG